jgi:hypothetical protein
MKNQLPASSVQLPGKVRSFSSMLAPRPSPLAASRGFTLLIAALTASIVLSLGASIFSIAKKQLVLSSISRESQYAFYAADTAGECVLYWDVRFGFFGTSTPAGIVAPDPQCNGVTLSAVGGGDINLTRPPAGVENPYPYTMKFEFSPNGRCAQVQIDKSLNTEGTVNSHIQIDGFNVDCASIATNPAVLERSIEIDY